MWLLWWLTVVALFGGGRVLLLLLLLLLQQIESLLPSRNVADFNQSLMDLGAQTCTPTEPDCWTSSPTASVVEEVFSILRNAAPRRIVHGVRSMERKT